MLFKKKTLKEHPRIELLGISTAQNRQLKAHLLAALSELAIESPLEEVSEVDKLLQYDISGIPAVVVNGKVIFQQQVPSVEELKDMISSELHIENIIPIVKKILVPTDFSAPADNALNYAIAIANAFGSTITLLHTYKVYSSTGMFVSIESFMQEDAAADLNRMELAIKSRLKNGARVISRSIRGDAVSVISDLADMMEYDLIVMGSKGASGLKEVFIGSVTNGVVQNTRTPVLVIPESANYNTFRNIVMAIDEKEVSADSVVSILVKIARHFQAKIKVYHKDVGEADTGIHPTVDHFLEPVEHSFHYEFENTDSTVPSIDKFVEETQADMLCLLHRKRSFIDEVFHLSVSAKEAFHSHVPLLILQD